MIGNPLEPGTWRWERACATWTFELTPAPGQAPATAMAACAHQLLAALPGFAVPATAEWTTESGGEDAMVHARGTRIDDSVLAATFLAHADVVQLALDLDLEVVAADGVTAAVIEEGARLHLEREDARLALWLDLNADVYARLSWGSARDNEVLGRLNAPRLAAFLARLRAATGARFTGVDAPDYAGQVSDRGFA